MTKTTTTAKAAPKSDEPIPTKSVVTNLPTPAKPEPAPTPPAPPSFDSMGGETVVAELDGTWVKEVGATVIGTIHHAYTFPTKRDDGTSADVNGLALTLLAPTRINVDGHIVDGKVGQIIGVTLGGKLDELLYFDVGSVVGIRVEKQVMLAGGRRTWHYAAKVEGKRRARGALLRPVKEAVQSDATEDCPL